MEGGGLGGELNKQSKQGTKKKNLKKTRPYHDSFVLFNNEYLYIILN